MFNLKGIGKRMKRKNEIKDNQGLRLKTALKYAQMTQAELSQKSYISQQSISKIVNNKAPLTVENAHAFAQILGVRYQYLLSIDGFITEKEKWKTKIDLTVKIKSECFALVAALGYTIIDMEENEDGTLSSMHRPNKIISIRDNAPEDEILSIARVSPCVRVYKIKSPDGRIAQIEDTEFLRLWQNIEEYARFQCEKQFECNYLGRYNERKDAGF